MNSGMTSKFHGSGGTVRAVAGCRASDAGFLGPGLATPSLGSIGQGPAGQGMARTRLTASANSCAQGQVFGDPQDQVAGSFDQASRSVQQPLAQGRRFGLGQRAVQ